MAIGKGTSKQLRIKRQASKGTLAAAATGGQMVRRETSNFELAKETYTTETEQVSTRQIMSARHGAGVVNGSLTGILSPGTYADPLSALLMRDFTAIPDITVPITVGGTSPLYTLTRGSGSFLTDGAKIGRVARLAGGFAAGNLAKNVLIVGATATVLTVFPLNRKAMVPEGPIADASLTFPGGVTFVPQTDHTDIYYTVEEWMSDIPRSQRNGDVKFHAATIRMPGSGNAGIDFTATGLFQEKDTTAYFQAPAPETTTDALVAASGVLFVNGVAQAVVTDLSLTLDGRGAPADAVVGSTVRPDVFTGKLSASGSMTAYDDSGVLSDLYLDETNTTIVMALSAGTADNADFLTLVLGQVKLNSSTPDDPEVGRKRTYNFSAQYNRAGGTALATNATTVEMQDSAVVLA